MSPRYDVGVLRRRRVRQVASWLVGGILVALAVGLLVLIFTGNAPGSVRSCTTEAVIGPDGRGYSRDPQRDCRFVDRDGNELPG
jgi:hypothetical protein